MAPFFLAHAEVLMLPFGPLNGGLQSMPSHPPPLGPDTLPPHSPYPSPSSGHCALPSSSSGMLVDPAGPLLWVIWPHRRGSPLGSLCDIIVVLKSKNVQKNTFFSLLGGVKIVFIF